MDGDNGKNGKGAKADDENDEECPPPNVSSPPPVASSADRQRSDANRLSVLDDRLNAKARPGPRATKPGAIASAAPADNAGTTPSANLSNLERDVLAKSRARGTGVAAAAAAAAPGAAAAAATPGAVASRGPDRGSGKGALAAPPAAAASAPRPAVATAAGRQTSDASTNIANLDNRIMSKAKPGPRATTPGAVAAISEDDTSPAAALTRLEDDVLAKSRARGSGTQNTAAAAAAAATPGAVSSQSPDRAAAKASGRSATASMAIRNQTIQSHMTADELAKSRAKADRGSAAQAATVDLAAGKMRADESRHQPQDHAPPLVSGVSDTGTESISKKEMVQGVDNSDHGDGVIMGGVAGGIATAAVATAGNGEGGQPSQPRQPDEAATLTPLLHDSSPVDPNTEVRASYFEDDVVYDDPGGRVGEDYPAMDMITEEIPIDETTGGIQAFVMPTVYDASNVQVIQSDEEQEAEARKKYVRKVMIVACLLAVVAVAIAVPVSIATGGRDVKIVVTDVPSASPTSVPSSMPSLAPTTSDLLLTMRSLSDDSLIDTLPDEFREAVTLFREQNVSTLEQLQDRTSPQAKALEWVSNEDPMALEYNNPKIIQRYIMTVFYYSMDGDNWLKCSKGKVCQGEDGSWLSEEDECNWFGSKCVNGKLSQIFQGTSSGNGVRGKFPKEICYFTEIDLIALHNNMIGGTIPGCFGRFTKLKQLVLTNNEIELPLPDEAVEGWKSKMQLLFLGENNLKGTFPMNLLQLSAIEELDLHWNDLTGPFPEFNAVGTPLLKELDIARNSLRGTIPSSLFDLPRLEYINITNNFANGIMPPNIGRNFGGDVSKLTRLDFGKNQLIGEIPDLVYNATGIKKLILSLNNITGKIRPDIFTSLVNLKELVLDNNQFSGPVPENLADQNQLNVLALQKNNFVGEISNEICDAKDPEIRADFRIQLLTLDCGKVSCDPPCCEEGFECVL